MKNNYYSNDGYDFFELTFKNRQDLILYLKTAKTSNTFFGRNLASEMSDKNGWYKTSSLEEAIKLFETGWYEDFDKFLKEKKQIDKCFPYISNKRNYRNYIYGSIPNIVNTINNQPFTMRKIFEDDNKQRTITINYNCSCPWYTSQERIYRNGLLTLSLIDFFDSMGYIVDLNFFSITTELNQIVKINVFLKNPGERINLQKLYFAFCNPSFLRRLILRVKETIPGLEGGWTYGYGKNIETQKIRELLKINKSSILINWPQKMGVMGINIEDDINSFLNTVMLNEYIELDEKIYNIYDEKNVLVKKRR